METHGDEPTFENLSQKFVFVNQTQLEPTNSPQDLDKISPNFDLYHQQETEKVTSILKDMMKSDEFEKLDPKVLQEEIIPNLI